MPRSSNPNPKLILASGSPRRSELIALTGWKVDIRPVVIDESERPGEDGLKHASRLAQMKALAKADLAGDAGLILAADTVVDAEGEILGKPDSNEAALAMLLKLRGKEHRVHTSIALYHPQEDRLVLDACTTEVPMRRYGRKEVEAYVSSGSPLDKAGAYGIQDETFQPVEVTQMTGCYANVVGLPLCNLVRLMREFDHDPPFDVPSCCVAHTGYDCEVYPQILRDET